MRVNLSMAKSMEKVNINHSNGNMKEIFLIMKSQDRRES